MMIIKSYKDILNAFLNQRVQSTIFIFLSVIFFTVKGFAGFEDSLKYEVDEEQLIKPSVFEYHQISQSLQAEGYESLYDGILAQKLLFDQAYVSQDFKKNFAD